MNVKSYGNTPLVATYTGAATMENSMEAMEVPTPGHVSGENHGLKGYRQVFIEALFWPRYRSNLSVHCQRNGQRGCGTYLQWNITQS